MDRALLITGGVFNVLFVLYHLTFWKNPKLNWAEELPRLNDVNRAILQVTNVMMIYVFLFFAALSFLLSAQQSRSAISNAVILFIGGFYLVRAILHFPLFGVAKIGVIIFIVCLLISGCYFAVLL
jgi:magnesium-transporting ATPase (P-type)